MSEFLPVLAAALGAKRPLRVPRSVGRLMAGEVAVVDMTEIRGASNNKAKRELGWQLRYPSWRQGFAGGLVSQPPGEKKVKGASLRSASDA